METVLNQILLFASVALLIFYVYQKRVRAKALLMAKNYAVKDVMLDFSDLICFQHGVTMEQALLKVLKSYQEYFPVLHADNLIGILKRNDLLKETITSEANYISAVMNREFQIISPELGLDAALKLLSKSSFLVVHDGLKSVGLLIKEKAVEYLLVLGLKQEFKEDK